MKVIIAARKGADVIPADRVSFEQALKECTVLVLCLPRTPDTLNLISAHELQQMKRQAIVINVSRGGILDEEALVAALSQHQIAGAATDVYFKEPAGPSNSPLMAANTESLNLTVSPHLAWYAESTLTSLKRMAQQNVTAWCDGKPCNVVG